MHTSSLENRLELAGAAHPTPPAVAVLACLNHKRSTINDDITDVRLARWYAYQCRDNRHDITLSDLTIHRTTRSRPVEALSS
jgi:hypothetical protein